MQATTDPDVFIVSLTTRRVRGQLVGELVYYRRDTKQEWTVTGTCNRCGLCVIGAARTQDYVWSKPPGTPDAVTDLRVLQGRMDEPVTPGFIEDMQQMAAQTPTATVAGCALEMTEYTPSAREG